MKRKILYLCLFFLTLLACKKETKKSKDQFDIFLIMGQSNTENGYGLEPSIDYLDDGVLQLGRNNGKNLQIIKATEPLENWDPRMNRIGFGLTFAKLYKHQLLPVGRKVLLIACGKGSSGFNNGGWNKGDKLYNDAVQRAKWVIENFPGSRIKCILWHQGEQDVGNQDYAKELDAMILNIRNDLYGAEFGKRLPFIAGGLVPFWVMKETARQQQEAIIEALPDRLPSIGFADPKLPFIIEKMNNDFDTIHYDANGQRELGRRYFTAYSNLLR